jgi:hypothetical protein
MRWTPEVRQLANGKWQASVVADRKLRRYVPISLLERWTLQERVAWQFSRQRSAVRKARKLAEYLNQAEAQAPAERPVPRTEWVSV